MNTVSEYISRVKVLCGEDPEREIPVIAIAGPVNAGKSTLVNSLLDQRICPDDVLPSTLFPVHFSFAENFSARKTVKGRPVQLTGREFGEMLKNRRKSTAPERADVFLPSAILRWCSLLDTPGVGLKDGADALVKDCLSGADGIVFLFHQRGIDSATHRFLTDLAAPGPKGWVSFWINANLGLIDGTSLTETGQALKAIFPGRAEVYAINARNPASTGLLSLFLQVRALESAVRSIEARLVRRDRLLPSLVERASLVKDEDHFLLKFWEIFEEAGTINHARQAIRDLPLIYGSLVYLLRSQTCRLTAESPAARALPGKRPAGPGPRESLASLVGAIQSDRELSRWADRDLFKRAAGMLGEKFRVVVAGPFSTGKTTFLNALLGETLLPAEDRATTSCAVRVGCGDVKRAEVEYLFRAEFHPVYSRGGSYTLDRQEVLAITQILENPPIRELISECQVCRDGLYHSIPLSQLGEIIDGICRFYSRDPAAEITRGSTRIPLFSRRVASSSPPGPSVTAVRLTLGSRGRTVFRLDDDRQRLEFYRAISPPGAFLVDSVTISYPSPNLALADFIDTPGLDSLRKRHQDRAAAILSSGDLALFFLNARQVLTQGVPGQIAMRSLALKIPVVYVVNFADTIPGTEQERVTLYIRQVLGSGAGAGEIIPYPQVYAISALNALRRGDEGFDRLMRRVGKKIGEIEARKVSRAAGEITGWIEKITGPDGPKNIPDRARQAALRYLGAVERLQRPYF